MNQRILQDLGKAKALYSELRLAEVYPLLKRFFDRLPFKYEPEHAEYFGMFVRTLFELGKESELQFYALEFEKIAKKDQDPWVRYHTVYAMTELGKYPANYSIREVEDIIRTSSGLLKTKAKFLLAHFYDIFARSSDDMIVLLEHIERPEDPELARFWETWAVRKLRFQKKFSIAKQKILLLLEEKEIKEDWYTSFTLQVYLCGTYLDMKEMESAKKQLELVKKLVEIHPLRTCLSQCQFLEDRLWGSEAMNPITLKQSEEGKTIVCGGRNLKLQEKSAAEKVLQLMLMKGFIDKEMIVKTLYDRKYASEKDDKLIYYHIHGVRDLLTQVGLPRDVVENKDSGYQLKTEVILEEET